MNKIINLTYYWTYLNLLFFTICIIIGLIGIEINYPKEWATITIFSMFYCFIFFLSPLLCLYMRDKFDLINMENGESHISQWVWIIMGLLVNITAALTQIVGIRELLEIN